MIKIKKNEFLNYINYKKRINNYNLEDLDLSEFNIVLNKKTIKELKFAGLDNFWIIKILLEEE